MRCSCGGSWVLCECRECAFDAIVDKEIVCGVCGFYPALFADFHRVVLGELGVL